MPSQVYLDSFVGQGSILPPCWPLHTALSTAKVVVTAEDLERHSGLQSILSDLPQVTSSASAKRRS